jgi:hypothetical protein
MSRHAVKTPHQRFIEKYVVDQTTGCWNWTGCTDDYGYGNFRVNGVTVKAHRWINEYLRGPIPTGILVCHHCDNPRCVNPSHLFRGTHHDNNWDALLKGRNRWGTGPCPSKSNPGEKHPRATICDATATLIRLKASEGDTIRSIASEFHVSHDIVRKIVTRKTWKHL